jgi:hypothetical protein
MPQEGKFVNIKNKRIKQAVWCPGWFEVFRNVE